MAESPLDKSTRKIVKAAEAYPFYHQATIYLSTYNDDELNVQIIKRLKRLITSENPDTYMMYFITKLPNTMEDGVITPVITFKSLDKIKGTSVLTYQKSFNGNEEDGGFKIVGKRKEVISTNLKNRYQGWIDRVRKGLFHLGDVELPDGIHRFGFLNEKYKPNKVGEI